MLLFFSSSKISLLADTESLIRRYQKSWKLSCTNEVTWKLLALSKHLTRIQSTLYPTVSYLSPDIQNEFVELLGPHVKSTVISEVKVAKYYSIIFDTTPDQSHVDQMSQVLRYVHISHGHVAVKELFVDFVRLEGKTAAALAEQILSKLKEDNLDVWNIRGQGYDYALTMSRVPRGVQRRIIEINPKAAFMPFNNHSLNLAGVHAAASAVNAVTFFGTVERLYNFFLRRLIGGKY